MNALVPIIPEKVAVLIPRLASDKPGEVVATAAAIGRQLRKHGADWHDLAAMLTRSAPAPKEALSTYAEAVDWLLDRADELISKERKFVGDMRGILRRYDPRPKQASWLVGLVERLGGAWAGPDPEEAGYG